MRRRIYLGIIPRAHLLLLQQRHWRSHERVLMTWHHWEHPAGSHVCNCACACAHNRHGREICNFPNTAGCRYLQVGFLACGYERAAPRGDLSMGRPHTGTLAATGCEGMGEFSLRVLWLRGTMSSLIRDCEEIVKNIWKENRKNDN